MSDERNEIERLGLFYDKNSFDLDISYARDYIKSDLNMQFTLFRVNHQKSKSNNIYGETKAKNKVFMKPVHLFGIINMGQAENRNLNGSGIAREEVTNVMIGVYKDELEEAGVKIQRGDFIGYYPDGNKLRYFEITNANYVDYSTEQTIGGIASVFKKMVATPVREDVILKFNE